MLPILTLVPSLVFFAYMSILWAIGLRIRNAGLVDLGWSSGFTGLAFYLAVHEDGLWQRRLLICGMYAVCGFRFVLGWTIRTCRDGEDRRWEMWRHRWQAKQGWLGIRSVSLNFFAFYHAQTFATLWFLMAPAVLACQNTNSISWIEITAVSAWIVCFFLENLADFQLDQFRKGRKGSGRVCRFGLWAYSRHPNYFFELCIWICYSVFALPSVRNLVDSAFLMGVPFVAYWFLVHFTGIPMTERASLQKRGREFAIYQREVSRLVPLPRKWSSEER